MQTLAIRLLGRFSVSVGGVVISADAWRSRRGADVVKLLALAHDHRMHRAQAMEAIWPESEPEASGTNLRKALHFARLALGGEQAIVNERGVLVLWPDARVETDVENFEAAAQRGLDAGDEAVCREAAELYRGDLLPDDIYESWAVESRARLRRRYLEVLRAGALWDRLAREDPPTSRRRARSCACISRPESVAKPSAASNGCAKRSATISVSGRILQPSLCMRTCWPSRASRRPPMRSAHTRYSRGPSCT